MTDIFIAHVEEDAEVALEIALGLEEAGYTTWCYEVDSIPGPSYLIQTGQAVEQAKAMVLIISPHSLGSRQVTKEVIRAHETGREFIPVLRDITHIEFQNRQPEWREALGAASSIRIPMEGVAEIVPRIISGLKASGILPGSQPEAAHIAQIRKAIGELQGRGVPERTSEPPITATKPKPEDIAAEIQTVKTTEETGWYKKWGWLALIAFAVIAASIIGAVLFTQPEPTSTPNDVMPTLSTHVNFADSNLYSAICEATNKATGPIYSSDLQLLTRLSAQGRNISDLTGLEHCVNLQVLNIYENNISDVTPLARLTSLRELYIYKNSISDISPLAGLVGLEELWLGRNNISDISPLRGLTNLNVLVLIYNNVTDVSPLVENKGLSNGDTVNLAGNPLSMVSVNTYIPQLEQRGVTVLGKPEVTPTPMPQTKCPISCSADSEGWSLVFECEEEGQTVTKTYYPGFTTEFKDGRPYVHGEMDFRFETSGNVYHATIDVRPCSESSTGYCITAEVTGDTLGNDPETCKNF